MLTNYIKIALAVLKRRKFFTFVNLFGISFTLAILLIGTALLDHIFGKAAPEVNQHRTLGIYRVTAHYDNKNGMNGGSNGFASYRFLEKYMKDLPGVEKTAIAGMFWKVLSYVEGQRVESFLRHVNSSYFEILQYDFIEGRPFSFDENENADFVAVINSTTRERFFGGKTAIGKSIKVAGKTYRVVGVVQDISILRLVPFSDIWVPISLIDHYSETSDFVGSYLGLMLAEKRSFFPRIREEFLSRMDNIDLEGSKFARIVAVPETLFDNVARILTSQANKSEKTTNLLYLVIITLAVLFMVLPTVNMVNLNISRIMERSSEIGIRKAFGAPSATLIEQFIVENIFLTLVGGILGLILAYLGLILVSELDLIPYAQFSLNYRIFFYGFITTLFFGFFSGVYPAWRMSRMHPVEALRGGVS